MSWGGCWVVEKERGFNLTLIFHNACCRNLIGIEEQQANSIQLSDVMAVVHCCSLLLNATRHFTNRCHAHLSNVSNYTIRKNQMVGRTCTASTDRTPFSQAFRTSKMAAGVLRQISCHFTWLSEHISVRIHSHNRHWTFLSKSTLPKMNMVMHV